MAITSVGYDGTVDEAQWASMVSKVGSYEYGVDGAGHFAVSQSAGTRMISVAPGLAWGRGVMDISDAASVIQLDPVSSGSRWDLIALRRTWGPANGGPTAIVVIKGTSAKAIPTARLANPGVADDQPLALVRVQAGSASIPEIIDLRVWGRNGGQLFAKNDLVRSYVNSVGTEIDVNGTQWQRVSGSNNTASWVSYGFRSNTGLVRVSTGMASGWGFGAQGYMQYRILNGVATYKIRFERTGSALPIFSNGDISNVKVATAPSAVRPSEWATLTSGPTGPMSVGAIFPSGEVQLTATSSGRSEIAKGDQFVLTGTFLLG